MKNFFARLITLPDPIKAGLMAVVLYVVSIVFTNLILFAPFLQFLEQFKMPLASGLALALIAWIQKVVPDLYEKVAIAALELVLAILAIYGIGVALAAKLPSLLAP